MLRQADNRSGIQTFYFSEYLSKYTMIILNVCMGYLQLMLHDGSE